MPVPFLLVALVVVVAVGALIGISYSLWSRHAESRDPVLRWHQKHVRALMRHDQDEATDFPHTVMQPLSDWQKSHPGERPGGRASAPRAPRRGGPGPSSDA